ncbi:unnamed protein product [Merluccius merluccius]
MCVHSDVDRAVSHWPSCSAITPSAHLNALELRKAEPLTSSVPEPRPHPPARTSTARPQDPFLQSPTPPHPLLSDPGSTGATGRPQMQKVGHCQREKNTQWTIGRDSG